MHFDCVFTKVLLSSALFESSAVFTFVILSSSLSST